MEYVFLGLLAFGGWAVFVWLFYWFAIRKLLEIADELTPAQRLELLKTRRQRYLK